MCQKVRTVFKVKYRRQTIMVKETKFDQNAIRNAIRNADLKGDEYVNITHQNLQANKNRTTRTLIGTATYENAYDFPHNK